MNEPLQPTEEQIAAAQLRIELDKKLGRETPEIVREIATHRPTERPSQRSNRNPLFTQNMDNPQDRARTKAVAWKSIQQALQDSGYDFSDLEVEQRASIHHLPYLRHGFVQTGEPEVLNNLGVTLRDLGHQEDAVRYFHEALALLRHQGVEADERSTTE